MKDLHSTPGVPRPVLIVAIALGLLLAGAVVTLGLYSRFTEDQQRQALDRASEAEQRIRREGPLALPPVPAPEAGSPDCAAVLTALPRELVIDGQPVPRRDLAAPAPPATVAWGDAKHDPVTVRCGVDAPAELTPTSRLVDISGVSWLSIGEGGATSWVSADRPVFVVLTTPPGSGSGPVQDLSLIVRDRLPKQDIFP